MVWMLIMITIDLLILQYLRNRSIWLDEAMLSISIIEKRPMDLFKTLEFGEMAPILFLLIEKFFTWVFGNGELALRLFPLIATSLSLPLFFDFGVTLTRNRMMPFLAICLFACMPRFIYYSSEVKQYASDMFVLCAIYFAALSESPFAVRNRRGLLTITGAVAIFLSNTSVIPLTIVGGLFIFRCIGDRRKWTFYLLPFLVWAGCFIVNYFTFEFHNPSAAGMYVYWHDYFMPWPWQHGFKGWIAKETVDVFNSLLPRPDLAGLVKWLPAPYILGLIVYLGSVVYLIAAKKFRLLYLCVAPVLLHLLLAALKIYPFDLRLILYLVPLFVLVMAIGLCTLINFLFQWASPFVRYAVVVLLVLVFGCTSFDNYPYRLNSEDMKPVLDVMNQNITDSSNIYVYYGGRPAFRYYWDMGYTHFGNARIVYGDNHTDKWEGYLKEIEPLKGPTWLLMSHGTTAEEEQYILKAMAAKGPMLAKFDGYGSRGYLFDLK